ncbi:hypothetical protein M1M27_gp01 [Cellulophaga phage Ingeline_1]|uniref:Uncharacterized protein n=1 Tax=Cellulophaga phage Ingeline_1 TaxID=2745674 RepID=A0A8E4ZL46_9CAUD|nr:hypothetical protein M1M27_gp01 [Cellulophaga phage Ingeline_1]QQV90040.1 hypothetical protein Ingeline2_50 [Cellulophaga phage Ingeline_2]QQV90090.1 hypothetical protein Ingeline3_50 [Cellulophaga phage Ingeline_3]QQV90140.1 hypothetical protein Ingeline4_50 [Cellulophaga phage Ingeline_4]QQV90188.1 hypothetical protein Ingeline5_49 [Cellulophaga phage Ingeline_5]QQV90239.1 hypothetical protein Ingeline6_50 [Cellulophaga phage Ingeline_6]QQV90289.1 hypothetical protein Ingeline7_50 [Cellu
MGNVLKYTEYQTPITLMRNLTRLNQPFRLEFRKVDGSRRIIQKALLRKQSLSTTDKRSAYKLNYINSQSEQMGSCYIPLLISVNDQKIILHEQSA